MELYIFILSLLVTTGSCSDITAAVFGNEQYGMPAAFGDFNSDELTDLFVLSNDAKTVTILIASVEEPLFRPEKRFSCSFKDTISSVVPGNFDGDIFMDVLVITTGPNGTYHAHILWGGNDYSKICNDSEPLIVMSGQPLAIDYNQNSIIDLFGSDVNGTRTFWVFGTDRTKHDVIPMDPHRKLDEIRRPHSNAFLDLNDDFYPDIFVTTEKHFEIWNGHSDGFSFQKKIKFLDDMHLHSIGQSLFLDMGLTGKMDLIIPVCFHEKCSNSSIMVYSDEEWHTLPIKFKDEDKNELWGFALEGGHRYVDTITLRGGDFNMDGYPDLLATLNSTHNMRTRSFLLENVPCEANDHCAAFNRTFAIRWNALSPFYNETVMAVFYDFYQDGILDVIFVELDKQNITNPVFKTTAFKNSLDYDANFVKVMVLTGRANSLYPVSPGSIGKRKRTYGTNLPGPSIAYKTTTQDGRPRSAIAAQLPQSAHFSLNLPFIIFGLGRTPNFIDSLTIGLANRSREWPQIIPNSQMVVISYPINDPNKWKVQLFVTPSKLILLSAAALTGTCGLITLIIGLLYWKERREDKIEKLQEAHRFHFDAM